MKLIIASNNAHKIYEIKKILSGKFDEIVSLREAGIDHETVEDGVTFAENALKKAREIAEISACASLADDSGISANALDGALESLGHIVSGAVHRHGNRSRGNPLQTVFHRSCSYSAVSAAIMASYKAYSAFSSSMAARRA